MAMTIEDINAMMMNLFDHLNYGDPSNLTKEQLEYEIKMTRIYVSAASMALAEIIKTDTGP